MKRSKKLSLINIHDYPRNCYDAYFAYRASEVNPGDWIWVGWIFGYDAVPVADGSIPALEESQGGGCVSEDEARGEAQTWIYNAMQKYRRETPRQPFDDAMVQQLVDKFDEFRNIATDPTRELPVTKDFKQIQRTQLFGMLDRIRGELKAQGVTLKEAENIAYAGATEWTKG